MRTVQQPSLPGGDALHELYREMSDEDYLDEEAGRRATAGRLLDLVGRYVPRGGCSTSAAATALLVDEARKRGYGTDGLELSRRRGAARPRRARPGRARVPLESLDPTTSASTRSSWPT